MRKWVFVRLKLCEICLESPAVKVKRAESAQYSLCETCFHVANRSFNKTRGKNKRPVDVPSRSEWIHALKRSYRFGFHCEISGIKLVTDDSGSPFYLTLDHVNPSKKDGGWMIVAASINDIKSDLTLEEFQKIIALLAAINPAEVLPGKIENLESIIGSLSHWNRGQRLKKQAS